MFALLLPLCFILLFLCSCQRISCWRTCFLFAALIWGFLVFASTELLSLFSCITFGCILGFWTLVAIASGLVFGIRLKNDKQITVPKFSSFPVSTILLLSGIIFTLIITGLIAIIAPPSTWDSMTYHMSRVVHWIQNQSVTAYPTSIMRQLTYPPWAEYAIMHFQILSFGDRFANFIQWFSLIGSIIGVSLIAKQLGADRKGQILTSLITATIPVGILQSSSTQNDYTVAFWLICFVYYLILLRKDPKSKIYALAAGVGLGLSLLTKGTAYFYALPFLIWFALSTFKKLQWNSYKPLLVILMSALFINGGYYARNFDLTKSFLPNAGSERATNEVFNASALGSNIIRNIGLHLGTPSESINTLVEKGVYGLHTLLRMDIADPRTTFGEAFHFPGHPFHEDHASNLLHLVLIISGIILLLKSKYMAERKNTLKYFLAVTAGFLLFNLFIKWQPWGARLHLPLFVLYAPFIGIVISKTRDQKTVTIVGMILLLYAVPWLFYNQSRPLIGKKNIFNTKRIVQYFANNPGFQYSYISAVNYVKIRGCSRMGMALAADSWEYPLWALAKGNNDPGIRLEHINVANASSIKSKEPSFSDFKPCAIFDDSQENKTTITFGKDSYVKTKQMAFLSVFMRDPTGILARRALIFHFNNVIEYSSKANTIFRKGNVNGVLVPQAAKAIFNLRREQLQEARLVDTDELNHLHDGLGDTFSDYLVKGLELILVSYATQNKARYSAGQELLSQWNSWVGENTNIIMKSLSPHTSRK